MTPRVASRARIYDAFALLVTLVVVALDQWTKFLVVTYLSPPESKSVPLVSQYLILFYIQNRGAAFSMLQNTAVLIVLITIAMLVVSFIYVRILNTGPLYFKVIFGLIIGGALGNVIDRIHNGGYVVDFIAFRIPQINFYFAIFNVADACITIGVLLLFVCIFFSRRPHNAEQAEENASQETVSHK